MSENLSSSEFAERSTSGQTVNVSHTPARNVWGAVSRALGGRPFVVLFLEYLETVQKCSPIIVSHCLRSRWENFDWYAIFSEGREDAKAGDEGFTTHPRWPIPRMIARPLKMSPSRLPLSQRSHRNPHHSARPLRAGCQLGV